MKLEILNRIDLSKYNKHLHESMLSEFNNLAGKEHYRLLNYICKGSKLVFDIGTNKGSSAIAMSSAKKVISYDIADNLLAKPTKNIIFKIGNALSDDDLLKADIILLDVNHDGKFENAFYQLIRHDYKGILIVDDIHYNLEMERFWASITEHKEDITDIGHYTGTGIVYFNDKNV